MHLPATTDSAHPINPERAALLRRKAEELEANFLSEMLSHTGLDDAGDAFSGGIGEDQFKSFLRDAQARAMVEHGGIGLTENIFNALVRRENDQK